MSDRGTNDTPNTRNPDRPAAKPSRLDQFADDIFDDRDVQEKGDVTSRKEKQKWLK